MHGSTDHWRTHPADIVDLLRYFGLDRCAACVGERSALHSLDQQCRQCQGSGRNKHAGFDLDVASNHGSMVPCRVALYANEGILSDVSAPDVLQTPVTVGGRGMSGCGLTREWDPGLLVWANPPFSGPAPWVVRMLLHAWRGGRGLGVLPLNMLEGAWGQALLWAANVPRVVFSQLPVAAAHAVLGPLFAAKGVSEEMVREYYALIKSPPAGRFGIYIPTRRLGFIDLDGTPRVSNRIGTMIISWGFADAAHSGFHSVMWPRRLHDKAEKYPVISKVVEASNVD